MQNQTQAPVSPPPFSLHFVKPFSTFLEDGTAAPIPYLVDGLFTEGGLSVLGAKPKQSKSSISRYLAVCVAKGTPFLGRTTRKGDVVLISLEDPLIHTDNHLKVLGYDPSTDGQIQIVERLAPRLDDSIAALREALSKMKNVRLVVIDHLAKLLRVADLSDYVPVMAGVEKLRNVAREFPHIHILAIAHCKKVVTVDTFDSFLGSTALRGETDTNMAIYEEDRQRVIAVETRIGRPFPASILRAELVESGGAVLVRDFSIGEEFDQWKALKSDTAGKNQQTGYSQRVIEHLEGCEGATATQQDILACVRGKDQRVIEAIKDLESQGVVSASGRPLTIHLETDSPSLKLYKLSHKTLERRH